ncbi:ABC transporter permease [Eubacterium sp. 1001713B170207_170306_E7]|uniref:ABC transporter permease n=1 Tax=Eubacterium sp. 1001713B170207_170306_E7 TaxID=2787097 RepID=UPI0018990C7B|nr:ABC transporter permease [Eubacterium sp. 1001713B170207_170306_E7]
MQVFKTYFKIIKSNLMQMMIYIVIFIGLAVLFSMMTQTNDSTSFTPRKPVIAVVNHDEDSDLVRGFTDYLNQNADIVPLKDDPSTLKDALFFREVVYIATIPEGFTQGFMAGNNPEIIENTVPDSDFQYQMGQLVNQYFNTAQLYLKGIPDISQAELSKKTAASMDDQTTVTLDQVSIEEGVPSYSYYFNYLTYALLAVLILGISSIMMVFNNQDIKRRNSCAPMRLKSFNAQLAIASTVFSVIVWVCMLVVAFALYDITPENLPLVLLCSVNALLMTFTALGIAFLTGQFIKNYNIQSAVANVVSLGLCFLSGVFVPQYLLGDSVKAIASFTPTYWYIKANDTIIGLKSFSMESLSPVLADMMILVGFIVAIFAVGLMVSRYRQLSRN